jgi:hypothetical protein
MEPWYKVATPRREVREGCSFNPDEFAIALEQVVAGTAPEDYRDPAQFFARTCFTWALREHAGMVLRRLSGKTENTAPVLTLITLGSAPVSEPGFRSVVLGQLGESRLVAAIDADIAGEQAHARALDADTKGPLRDIYRRVGTAILFESSGGQTDKVAHLPELRFALGEPEVDTTSIDNAAFKSRSVTSPGSTGTRSPRLRTTTCPWTR